NLAILFVLLSLGLNIVVGFAGLLDLGYIAFFAVGAYTYALLASAHFTLPPFQPPPPLLDHPADRRRGGLLLRRDTGRADVEAAWRLPRDRHAGLRRDRSHLSQYPVAAGQPDQRAAGDHADRPVPNRRLELRGAGDFLWPRFYGSDQVLLLSDPRSARDHRPQPAAAELAGRPRLGGEPRGRSRGARNGHQHPQHEVAGVCDGCFVRRRLRRDF